MIIRRTEVNNSLINLFIFLVNYKLQIFWYLISDVRYFDAGLVIWTDIQLIFVIYSRRCVFWCGHWVLGMLSIPHWMCVFCSAEERERDEGRERGRGRNSVTRFQSSCLHTDGITSGLLSCVAHRWCKSQSWTWSQTWSACRTACFRRPSQIV